MRVALILVRESDDDFLLWFVSKPRKGVTGNGVTGVTSFFFFLKPDFSELLSEIEILLNRLVLNKISSSCMFDEGDIRLRL